MHPLARLTALAALGALAAASGPAPTVAATAYDRGKAHWRAAEYPAAHPLLLDARREPYGRGPEVDYMLGTGGCRVAELRAWGASALDWMLYAYPLTPESRAAVRLERDRCAGAPAGGPRPWWRRSTPPARTP
ncbi:MAG: hypothetical protein ACYDA8_20955, partial [Deferrisomatales bacterium]